MKITWSNRKEILEQLDKASCVRFAVFCAEQVKHLNDNPTVEAAINAAKVWLASPSEENADAAARAAIRVAANAANAANAADAAYAAADAANAANAAYCTYAARAAARAAYIAARAADINREQIKQEQVSYLKQLYLESLPEDERNCWLVQATIGI